MTSLIPRRIVTGGWFLPALVIVLSVAASSPLWGQGRHVTPRVQDLGPSSASQTVTASLVLKVQNPNLLETYVASTQDPSSPFYHRFLSLPSFVANFAPNSASIFILTQYLKSFGIQVTEVYSDHLLIKATGTMDAFNKAFSLDVHDFAQGGRRFHRPRRFPQIPFILRDILVTVFGPSDEARFHPMNARVSDRITSPFRSQKPVLPARGATATGVPGDYTVGDVANLYHINPLYKAHIDGHGQTIGIATLANFHPADAFTYWSLVGLNVSSNRITQVHVDGGGDLSADAGSGETSLDVEQSGGLAPGAKIIVYDAPNTDPGFIDLFYKAASDNLVDSLSVSWGLAEVYYYAGLNDGTDFTPQFLAFHQAFLELAAQGISAFASSGDNGAYDANDFFNDPIDNVLSVDSPAADPAITGAGGTTTPVTLTLNAPPPNTPPLVVSREQVWGWDYLQNYLVQYVGPQFQDALFPAGGGGGVSIFWPMPAYQAGDPPN
jgi:kumamolisin